MMDAKVTTTKAAVAVVEVTKAAIPITALSLLRRRKNNNNDNDDETCKQSSLPTLPLLLSSSIIQHQQQQQQQQQPSWFVLNSQYDKHNNNNNNNNNGKIIEISGEAGSGKTQLCLSTCVTCVTTTTTTATTTTATHNNNNNSNDDNDSSQQYFNAMYITMGSEGKQSKQIAQRLYQMIQHRIISSSTISSSNLLDKNIRSIMKRIHINHVHNEEDLLELVTMTLPKLLQKSNCGVSAGSGGSSTTSSSNRFGVIVLDSIAGIFRDYDTTTTSMNNYDQKNNHNSNDTNQQLTTSSSSSSSSSSSFTKAKYYAKRSELFYTISSHLKKLSFTYNVHIIIVNQVTTDFIHNYYNHHHKRRKMDHIDNNGVVRMKPALGLAWSYCVNDRFILSRCNKISCNSNSSSISSGSSSTTMNDILGGNNENNHENNDDSNKKIDCNIQSYARSLKLLASSRYSIHDKEVKFQIQPCGVVML